MDANATGTPSRRDNRIKARLLCIFFVAAGIGGAFAHDEPRVTPSPPAHLSEDAEIEAAVVKGIVANPEVFAARLHAHVFHGVVTLRGTVQSAEGRATAGKIARAVPGVREVRNRLLVRPGAR